ncbi:MAG: prolyl oligopeptidase family serine peptidase [Luteolibacter sp.]
MLRPFAIILSVASCLSGSTIFSASSPGSTEFSVQKDITFKPEAWPKPLIANLYKQASPVTHVTRNSPPVFIHHGTKDTLVPAEHPEAFIQKLEEKNPPRNMLDPRPLTHPSPPIPRQGHPQSHRFPRPEPIEKRFVVQKNTTIASVYSVYSVV